MHVLDYRLVPTAERSAILPLLLLGDEEVAIVTEYFQQGELFALYDELAMVGCVLFIPINQEVIELKNIAFYPKYQHHGFGSWTLNHFEAYYRDRHYQSLIIGTGDASFNQIAFYIKAGYRFDSIKKHFFSQYPHEIVENGIVLQDMVMFRKSLN